MDDDVVGQEIKRRIQFIHRMSLNNWPQQIFRKQQDRNSVRHEDEQV